MEEALKFLLVAAVIVIGLVRQVKKEAKKNAGKGSPMPTPEPANPLPENWDGGTYGGFIPEGPQPEPVAPAKTKKKSPKPFLSGDLASNHPASSTSYSNTKQTAPPPPGIEEPDESEFTIHSAEEARKAMVWSEILQRKY